MKMIRAGLAPVVELFLELVHRSVVRVTILYASSAIGTVTALHFVFQQFGLSPRYTTALMIVAGIGLVVTPVLAWAYDITPEGIVRSRSAPGTRAGAAVADAPAVPALGDPAALHGPIRSIAVLPFADHSPGRDQEYFSDGITEELLNVLARVEGIRVPARTSSFAFKGRNADVREIARTLGVEAVLEGSVRSWENELIITARLVHAADGCQLWSGRYRREMTDVFALQEEISAAIVATLQLRLDDGQTLPHVSTTTSSPNAYALYLKGRYFFNRGSEDGLRKAITFFTAAIQLDPAFAAAYAGLGDASLQLGSSGHLPPATAYRRGRRAAERAVELDAGLVEAHTALAWIALRADWDFAAAEAAYRKALALDPRHSPAHQGHALYLAYRGRLEEALAEARLAAELDPLSLAASNTLAAVLLYLGSPEYGVQQLQTSLELDPGCHVLHSRLALAHAHCGRYSHALALARQGHELTDGSAEAQSVLGYVAALAGDRVAAEQMIAALDEPARAGDVSPWFVAAIHVALGAHDRAFACLELAFARRDELLLALAVDPVHAPLRSDPRFADLARRVGLGEVGSGKWVGKEFRSSETSALPLAP